MASLSRQYSGYTRGTVATIPTPFILTKGVIPINSSLKPTTSTCVFPAPGLAATTPRTPVRGLKAKVHGRSPVYFPYEAVAFAGVKDITKVLAVINLCGAAHACPPLARGVAAEGGAVAVAAGRLAGRLVDHRFQEGRGRA